MTNPAPALSLSDVRLSFGQVRAVDGVSLDIGPDDLTAIIGPNGAGKTTLFNLITGRYSPDKGRVTFMGRDITGLAPYEITRQGLARSFQITNIFQSLSVFENVQVAHQIAHGQSFRCLTGFHRIGRDETAEILETVGLMEKSERLAGELSHGDQRTLEVALTLALKPRMLLLDEPTSGMSSWETSLISELITRINSQLGLPIIFVEHDMSVAFSAARNVVVMHQGQVFAQGPPEEVRCDQAIRAIYLGEDDDS